MKCPNCGRELINTGISGYDVMTRQTLDNCGFPNGLLIGIRKRYSCICGVEIEIPEFARYMLMESQEIRCPLCKGTFEFEIKEVK